MTRSLVDYREYTGQLEAVERADIRARVRGFLKKVHLREGTEVKAGALLYEIDPETFEAEVAKSQADVERQQAQLKLAAREAERAEQLITNRAISSEEYQQRLAAQEVAKAAVQQAAAALKSVKLELGYTKIRSPIAGRVGRNLVDEGNLVGFSEPTLLTSVVNMDPIHVYFEVAEREFLEYQRMIREQGAATAEQAKIPIFVGLASDEGFPHEGVIEYRDNRVDPGTGTIQLRGSLTNRERLLTPGLLARVRVPFGKEKARVLIAEAAIATDQRGPFVLLVKPDDTVEARKVQPGRVEEGMTIIEKGLAAEDRIIVEGLQRARPGTKVAPQEAGTSAPVPGGGGGAVTPTPGQVPTPAPPIGLPPAGPKTGQGPGS